MVLAPTVTAFAGASATIDTRQTRKFFVDVDRVADGPVDHAPALAYRPVVEEIREGLMVSRGRCREADRRRGPGPPEARQHLDRPRRPGPRRSETVENAGYGKASLEAAMQLPQVVEAKVDGDYEIPAGRQILVSLGTATTADSMGSPGVVMERLLLIRGSRPILTEAAEVRVGRARADDRVKAASVEGRTAATSARGLRLLHHQGPVAGAAPEHVLLVRPHGGRR